MEGESGMYFEKHSLKLPSSAFAGKWPFEKVTTFCIHMMHRTFQAISWPFVLSILSDSLSMNKLKNNPGLEQHLLSLLLSLCHFNKGSSLSTAPYVKADAQKGIRSEYLTVGPLGTETMGQRPLYPPLQKRWKPVLITCLITLCWSVEWDLGRVIWTKIWFLALNENLLSVGRISSGREQVGAGPMVMWKAVLVGPHNDLTNIRSSVAPRKQTLEPDRVYILVLPTCPLVTFTGNF